MLKNHRNLKNYKILFLDKLYIINKYLIKYI